MGGWEEGRCLHCIVFHPAELMSSSEAIGGDALKFLQVLKKEKPGSGSIAASANDLQKVIRQLERLAGVSTSSEMMFILTMEQNLRTPAMRKGTIWGRW